MAGQPFAASPTLAHRRAPPARRSRLRSEYLAVSRGFRCRRPPPAPTVASAVSPSAHAGATRTARRPRAETWHTRPDDRLPVTGRAWHALCEERNTRPSLLLPGMRSASRSVRPTPGGLQPTLLYVYAGAGVHAEYSMRIRPDGQSVPLNCLRSRRTISAPAAGRRGVTVRRPQSGAAVLRCKNWTRPADHVR